MALAFFIFGNESSYGSRTSFVSNGFLLDPCFIRLLHSGCGRGAGLRRPGEGEAEQPAGVSADVRETARAPSAPPRQEPAAEEVKAEPLLSERDDRQEKA